MGTSTNCSAFCGRQTAERCGIRSREILGTAITCSTSARAQEVHHPVTQLRHKAHRGSARTARCPRRAPLRAAVQLAMAAPQQEVPAGRQARPRRPSKLKYTLLAALGRGVFWPMALFISSLSLSPGPCHRRSPWSSVVRKLGKGHCDAQAFVAKELPELSLPPSHGGSRSAVDSHVRQHEAVFTVRTQNRGNLAGKRLVLLLFVVVVFGDPPPSLPYQTLEKLFSCNTETRPHACRIQGLTK